MEKSLYLYKSEIYKYRIGISPLTSFGRDGSSWLIPQSISTVAKRSGAKWRNLLYSYKSKRRAKARPLFITTLINLITI